MRGNETLRSERKHPFEDLLPIFGEAMGDQYGAELRRAYWKPFKPTNTNQLSYVRNIPVKSIPQQSSIAELYSELINYKGVA